MAQAWSPLDYPEPSTHCLYVYKNYVKGPPVREGGVWGGVCLSTWSKLVLQWLRQVERRDRERICGASVRGTPVSIAGGKSGGFTDVP